MDNLTDLLLVLLSGCLTGAVWNCWLGRERSPAPRDWLPFRVRVVYAPRGRLERAVVSRANREAPMQEPKPEGREGKMAYTDQMLAQSVLAARRRLGALEQPDERLRKPASSLGWAVKT